MSPSTHAGATEASAPTEPGAESPWTTEDSERLYSVGTWGRGYFGVHPCGHVVVRPTTTPDHEIDLYEVVEGLRARGLRAPIVIRFPEILSHRLRQIHGAFARAIAENSYGGRYLSVYPIKVNQQRSVVEDVYRAGAEFGFGLEVGSKPELLAVMALTEESQDRLIVCNGFKDEKYIEGVILATKLGRAIIPVVENFDELRLILELAKRYNVRPRIGVRVKLAGEGQAGRWRTSVGARSKFGLFLSEVIDVFRLLRDHSMEDCLQLVHCHPGSQVQDIADVKEAVNELAHVYVELVRLGAGLKYIDVGGGLGVDYDGSQSNVASSINYTLQEYASDIVYRVGNVCTSYGVAHPTIVTESGRATVAYHSVLVFNVVGSSGLDRFRVERPAQVDERGNERPQPLADLFDAYESVGEQRLLECYHDAVQARQQAQQLFSLGYMTLEGRGLAERLYWATLARIRDVARRMEAVPEDLAHLETMLSETYFCNVSVFQSLPDSWAIGQLFPIMPIHRLDEQPLRKAVLADITCDSDGKIDCFVDQGGSKSTLDLHELQPGESYYLAAFLVGAYQEPLGDLHNLFGDTHVVHVRVDPEAGWWIDEIVKGETARDVLRYVQFEADRLQPRLARDCERAVRDRRMSVEETQVLLRFYEAEMNGYTYLQ